MTGIVEVMLCIHRAVLMVKSPTNYFLTGVQGRKPVLLKNA